MEVHASTATIFAIHTFSFIVALTEEGAKRRTSFIARSEETKLPWYINAPHTAIF